MKANILYGINDLRYEEIDSPVLKSGEVLLKVRAAGICGSDVSRVFKTGTYTFPTIIGHEFSGEVVQVYDRENAFCIGKRAAVFPLIPCMKCLSCKTGNYEMCSNYNYLGSRCNGGFADYVSVPFWNLAFLSAGITFEEAAMFEPAAVAMHAIKRSKIKLGDTVAIFGPGTIGLILAQLATIAGASKVLLFGRDFRKLEFAKNIFGFEYVCNSKEQDPVKWTAEHTSDLGVDVAVEGTGSGSVLNSCLDVVKSAGTILALGNPLDDMNLDKSSYWKLLRRQINIYGTWNSSYGLPQSDWDVIANLIQSKRLNLNSLISQRFPMSQLKEGFGTMMDVNVFSNKVMLLNN